MDRRAFTTTMMAAATAAGASDGARAQSAAKPFTIGMIIFNDMTNQDFVGPHDAFSRVSAAQVHVLARTLDPVTTDSRLRVLPQMTLKDAPMLDMLFIGGGGGTTKLMEDREHIEFLRARAPTAQYITSVCTGALVLGAAGLLKGYKAATHWAAMDILPVFGAEPVRKRVVIDRNRITGGGVTAGIDFGLTVIGKLWGHDLAQTLQLGMEYAPEPPYNSGSPATAPAEILKRTTAMLARMTNERLEVAKRVAASL